ncbi:MAG TPA: NADH:ubiquinone reductase (Na(+)-transporting) subunit B [Candidatus Hydrogenedentes bacterium]|mgnify:CR=1 FL=1|nr:NADH:ubiquinone reductase (Na(+)-transporting) subunit B [Candidatus Hydrogenedentota bacterium]
MKALLHAHEKLRKHFEKGGKLEKLYPFFEAQDTFLFTPDSVTSSASHVRDGLDLKRMMITVVLSLIPCTIFAMWNVGYQANIAIDPAKIAELTGWQNAVIQAVGIGYNAGNPIACFLHGALYFLPVYFVTIAVGGIWEAVFAVVRKHEINEGFLVTSLLFPLTLPPTIPLWQVALGISFGVVFGKEVFGGTGMNFLNPALVARAFLFFAYPAQITGDKVWAAVSGQQAIDGFSGATILGVTRIDGFNDAVAATGYSWWMAFSGVELGSMGETSALACIIGAVILIATGVGSWRTMAGVVLGTTVTALLLNLVNSETNGSFEIPFYWHMVLGGWAFGTVFMATDPVSSAFTDRGKWVYGFMIGFLVVLIRVVNPAYPEAMMLSILFMNMLAPLIDHYVVKANIKRRLARSAA